MSKNEYIDILDENGMYTDEMATRQEVHQKGLWHRAIVVAIINEDNKILMQQRSDTKDKNPGKWDISVAGHISAGQDALSAAAREINEEVSVLLGFKTEIKDFRYMYSFRKQEVFSDTYIENQFYDFFILREYGLDDRTLHFQRDEVQAVKFMDLMEIDEMLGTDKLVNRPEVYNVLKKFLFRF